MKMRNWNNWGAQNSQYTTQLNDSMKHMLESMLGSSIGLPPATIEQVMANVPKSRLPANPLVTMDTEIRLRHARGHSFPDWLAMRCNKVDSFPDGVAFPETSEEVQQLLQYARDNNAAVIPYGGGTSVAGHINPQQSEKPVLTIDMGQMKQLLNLDIESRLAVFGAGVCGPELEQQLQEKGYTLGHYPQSWELSTLGGWIASRSSGQQSLHYGRIEQLFAGGKIETLKGCMDIPTFPASSAGPDIREIIMGSEGRMGIITEATVRVRPLPEHDSFHVIFFPSWEKGLAAVRNIAQADIQLSMVRLSNALETGSLIKMGGYPVESLEQALVENGIGEGKTMLTYGLTGSNEQCQFASQLTAKYCDQQGGFAGDDALGKQWAHGRFRAPYLREPLGDAGYAVDTMETALDWVRVPQAVENIETAIRNALQDENEKVFAYTHLSHVYGQGSSAYTTYLFRCGSSHTATFKRWQKLKAAGAQAIVDSGGTISHQHGVGVDHKAYLMAEKGPLGIAAIRNLSEMFDPPGLMNPGKLLPDAE
jgi:alkyldihydroxyacetonephosphate synthase